MYGQFIAALATKTVNLSTDALKVMLASASYTPSQAADQFASTPQAYEIAGGGTTGYTAGGVALSSVVIADTADTWTLSAANVSWANSNFSSSPPRYAIVYDYQTGAYTTSPVIGFVDFGAPQTTNGTTFEIDWANGVVVEFTMP